jgi:hypothetical protein
MILIAVVIIWACTFVICLLAQCGPNIAANFGTLRELKTECNNTFAILIALAASDVAVDLVILGIPMPLVRFATSPKSSLTRADVLLVL